MSESDETLEQMTDREILIGLVRTVGELSVTVAKLSVTVGELSGKFGDLKETVAELSGKLDKMKSEYDAQFEAIRQGIVYNDARFDRVEGNLLLFRADLKELIEEVRHNRKSMV